MLSVLLSLALLGVPVPSDPQTQKVCGVDPSTGKCVPLKVTSDGTMTVAGSFSAAGAADTVGSTVTLAALNTAASVLTAGQGGCGVHVGAGLTATLTPEITFSSDGSSGWAPTTFSDGTATKALTGSALDIGVSVVGGVRQCRARVSTAGSGSASAFAIATIAASPSAGSGGGGTVTQGAGAAAGAPWSTELSDGSAFYVSAKTGQFPAALDGSGFLKVHEQGTAAISAASLPLPTGAATEAGHLATIDTSTAKIPAQGQALAAASMPVVLPSAQITTLTPPAAITGYALDATLTGGTAKAIARGGAKGATTAADFTGTAEGADHQALDVQLWLSGSALDPRSIRALTSSDVVTAVQGTAAALAGAWPVKLTDGTNAAAVKAASTAAAAADPAVVVAISPNNTVAATESGTWTVQPGNTANTTPWLFDLNRVAGTATVTGGVAGTVGVGGLAATGAVPSGNPLLIAGRDSTGVALKVICDKSAFVNPSTATTTQIVALSGSTVIYVCAYEVNFVGSATANTAIFKYGTGSSCGTGTTVLSGTMFGPTATGSGSQFNMGSGVGYIMKTIAAQALCITTSAATTIGVTVSYAQF